MFFVRVSAGRDQRHPPDTEGQKSMIVANLATYPPRLASMLQVVAALAPQVDRLTVVLNQYLAVPEPLLGIANVNAVLPSEDLKDLGKFLPNVADAEYVFLVDDDIRYPADYVSRTLAAIKLLPRRRMVAGYHASIYRRRGKDDPRGARNKIAGSRRIINFQNALEEAVVVDQIASGTSVMRPTEMPPFDFMRGSQNFTDVRMSRWCFENAVLPVCLPRGKGWLEPIKHSETIYRGFTRSNPVHVAEEIWQYAFKVPGRGKTPMDAKSASVNASDPSNALRRSTRLPEA